MFCRSDLILHRIRSFDASYRGVRYFITVWFAGFMTNQESDLVLQSNPLSEEKILYHKTNPIPRIIVLGVYDKEFRDSTVDCFRKNTKVGALALTKDDGPIQQLLSHSSPPL